MNAPVCSRNHCLRQYLLIFDDELMSKFIENPSLMSCGLKTNCRVYLTNRWLNRAVRPGSWNRYFIINVSGEDQFAIDRCNRLIERCIPEFRSRVLYRPKSKITLYTNEWIPDNCPVIKASMRIGGQRSNFGTLNINSPYANTRARKTENTPWKISHGEILGHYETGDVLREIMSKAELGPVDFLNPHFPLHKDILKFNYFNSFDRYTSFKSLDNEHINKKRQEECIRLLNALKNKEDQANILNFQRDERQSSNYYFEPALKTHSRFTNKIKPSDIRGSSLHNLVNYNVFKTKSGANSASKEDSKAFKKQVEFHNETKVGKNDRIDNKTSSFDKLYDSQMSESRIEDLDTHAHSLASETDEDQHNFNGNQSNYYFRDLHQSPNGDNRNNKAQQRILVIHHNSCHGKYADRRQRIISAPSFIGGRRHYIHYRSNRIRYHRLMKKYLRSYIRDNSESKLTYITSTGVTETDKVSNASKSSNIDDNTLDSLNSF